MNTFLIFCLTTWEVHTHSISLAFQSMIVYSRGKALVQLFELQAELATVFMEHLFLIERITDKLWFFRCGWLYGKRFLKTE